MRYNWLTGESLRSADVTFATHEQAEAGVNALGGRRWHGAAHNGKWTVDWREGRDYRPHVFQSFPSQDYVLVAFGLGEDTTEDLLRDVFSNYGEVTCVFAP